MSTKKKKERKPFIAVYLSWQEKIIDCLEKQQAEKQTLATLLYMKRYNMHSGAVIEDCRDKPFLWWAIYYSVPRPELIEALHEDSDFWHWQGNDLHIDYYAPAMEAIMKGGSAGGKKKAANARARAAAEAAKVHPQPVEPPSTPASPASPASPAGAAVQDEPQGETMTLEEVRAMVRDALRDEPPAQMSQAPAVQDEPPSTPAAQIDAPQEAEEAAGDAPADFTEKGDNEQ